MDSKPFIIFCNWTLVRTEKRAQPSHLSHPISTPLTSNHFISNQSMVSLTHLCLLLIFHLPLQISTKGEQICDSMSCGEIDIQFPFSLKGTDQNRRCSYPDLSFQLSCDNLSRTILEIPGSGDLVVKRINYKEQTIQINDAKGCLPKRFLHNLSYSLFPPFMFDASVYDLYDITFLRCPSNVTDSISLPPVSCLSSHKRKRNSSVVMFSWWRRPNVSVLSSPLSQCEVMSTVVVPIPIMLTWPFWPDLTSDIELTWNRPRCGHCAARSKLCGFINNDTSFQVGCLSSPNHSSGLSRSGKYGLIIGMGIPGLLCVIALSCFICNKFKIHTHRHRPTTELPNPTSIFALQPAQFMMGLNGPEIEKFPKTLIGESGRLPRPNDNTCPICLSEYEPKETLRTIPECNHYFHAHCIDEWLKMNATCPICRNSPDAASSNVTPSSLYVLTPLSSSRTIDNLSPTHTSDAV